MSLSRAAATAALDLDDGVEASYVRTRDTVVHFSHETSAVESSAPGPRRPVPLFFCDGGIGASTRRGEVVGIDT